MRELRPKEIRIPGSVFFLCYTMFDFFSGNMTLTIVFFSHMKSYLWATSYSSHRFKEEGWCRESKESKVGHGASPVLSGWQGPGSAGLFFGLVTLVGGTPRAAESTMQAERPKVPGCSCFRIFLSSEISLVLLQGDGKYLVSFRTETPFCSLKSVVSNQESQFEIQIGLAPEYVINCGNLGGAYAPVNNLVAFLLQENELRRGWETAIPAASYVRLGIWEECPPDGRISHPGSGTRLWSIRRALRKWRNMNYRHSPPGDTAT